VSASAYYGPRRTGTKSPAEVRSPQGGGEDDANCCCWIAPFHSVDVGRLREREDCVHGPDGRFSQRRFWTSAGRSTGYRGGTCKRDAGADAAGEVGRLGARSDLKNLFEIRRQLLDFGLQLLRLDRIAPG
jgi:hypothetical protein